MERILIWGGTGFIGQHVAAKLTEAGQSVSIITRHAAAYDEWARRLGIRLFELLPSQKPEKTRRVVAEFSKIFNFAGNPPASHSNRMPQESLAAGCAEQLAFLEACAAAGHVPHVGFASSRLVYGQPNRIPVAEDELLAPRSMYAIHKVSAEHYHQLFALRGKITFTIARISNPYGYDPACMAKEHGFINKMICRALAGEPVTIFGDGGQLRDYLHISDLISALTLCSSHAAAKNQIFNIGAGTGISLRAATEQICARMGSRIVYAPWPEEEALVESGDYVSDIGKARKLIGFSPAFSFAEGVERILSGFGAGRRRNVAQAMVAR